MALSNSLYNIKYHVRLHVEVGLMPAWEASQSRSKFMLIESTGGEINYS